ncbi:hypothetical protein V8G54_017475 [Vigna mungo]|uniref:Cytochrome P450 n=1 Tax=Vigna mungo TaxID=3915 RepID=A0AAQ3NM04_VIGMU
MGKGLIPADLDTWKQRRRVIAPAFHNSYLEAMVKIFTACSERTILKVNKLLEGDSYGGPKSAELDLEAEFSSLALDIIGLGVFNYDFGSVTKESPVIKIISDFAFLPFGGGPRKCVGDQFALMESTVALTMLLQNFDVELKGTPESVELVTGATIHTKNGLWCKLKKRSNLH